MSAQRNPIKTSSKQNPMFFINSGSSCDETLLVLPYLRTIAHCGTARIFQVSSWKLDRTIWRRSLSRCISFCAERGTKSFCDYICLSQTRLTPEQELRVSTHALLRKNTPAYNCQSDCTCYEYALITIIIPRCQNINLHITKSPCLVVDHCLF